MKLSIVIPCYNEEEVLNITYEKLESCVNHLLQVNQIADYEVIFVDDGSRDNTKTILLDLAHKNHRIVIIEFNSNFGHQAAILAGILNSTGDAVISIDADLQDPPDYFVNFIEQYKNGNDVVIGIRSNRDTDTYLKRGFAKGFYRLAKFLGVPGEFNAGDYRLISRRVVLSLMEYPEGNLYLRGLIPSMKFKTGVVYYKREQRFAGTTKYPFIKSLELALNGITSFSVKPLRIIGFLGIIMFVISMLLIGWIIFGYIFTGSSVTGWTSTITIIIFFQSLNFIFLAVIGEYLGKIFLETKARPRYVINSKINFNQK